VHPPNFRAHDETGSHGFATLWLHKPQLDLGLPDEASDLIFQ
jgi:hypothetical protein